MRTRADRGASTVELAMYTPLLFFVLFLTVQAALFFLGNQAASAAAREAARVGRSSDVSPAVVNDSMDGAAAVGREYARTVGHGLIDQVEVEVVFLPGPRQVQATVRARGVRLVPGIPGGSITQVAQGPVEEFRPDP